MVLTNNVSPLMAITNFGIGAKVTSYEVTKLPSFQDQTLTKAPFRLPQHTSCVVIEVHSENFSNQFFSPSHRL